MMFFESFIIGVVIGLFIGTVVAGLLQMAKKN